LHFLPVGNFDAESEIFLPLAGNSSLYRLTLDAIVIGYQQEGCVWVRTRSGKGSVPNADLDLKVAGATMESFHKMAVSNDVIERKDSYRFLGKIARKHNTLKLKGL